MNVTEIVARSKVAAVWTDEANKVLSYNSEALKLLGSSENGDFLAGKRFFAALKARDVFGHLVPDEGKPFHRMVGQGEPVNGFELTVTTQRDERLRVALCLLMVLGADTSKNGVVYFLRPILRRRRADEAIERLLANNGGLHREFEGHRDVPKILTPRQTETLRMLADGHNNEQIAEGLRISPHTVRSHTQNVLAKLGVHSKAEAIARAFRDRLI